MKSKRTAILVVFFLLAQIVVLTSFSPAEEFTLNPPTKVDINNPDALFKDAWEINCTALSLYRDDAFSRVPRTMLPYIYGSILANSNIRLDLRRINRADRWLRCYPVSVILGPSVDKNFIVRIFRTGEAVPPADVPVLSEMVTEDLGITMQILPGPSEILKDCVIKPVQVYSSRQVDSSS